jgi:hypothetical protein
VLLPQGLKPSALWLWSARLEVAPFQSKSKINAKSESMQELGGYCQLPAASLAFSIKHYVMRKVQETRNDDDGMNAEY